jgi:biopolymer transport protein ExbD
MARIEMLPLIDVAFLLLVFFVYSMLSMVIHRGINVDLPQARSAVMDKKDYISLTVTKEGNLYLDKMKVVLKELEALLIQRKEANPNLEVFISGDRKAYYEKLIEVLDIVRISGLSKVSLETEFEE